jgi:hypothetical protein
VRDARDGLDVEHVDLRIAQRLGKDALRLRRDGAPHGVEIADVDESWDDAHLAEGHVELVDGAAVQGSRSNELVARIHQRKKRDVLCRLTGSRGHGTDAVFERGDALLEHGDRRVHDARVDIAEALQREEVRGVIGIFEDVSGGLINGNRP